MSNSFSKPLPIEKIIAILSYLSMGFIGFIYVLIAFWGKLGLKPFLKFHVYQSIFLAILCTVFLMGLNLVRPIFYFIPFINKICFWVDMLLAYQIIGNFTIVNLLYWAVVIYLCVGVLLEKYSYIPWVSDIMKNYV